MAEVLGRSEWEISFLAIQHLNHSVPREVRFPLLKTKIPGGPAAIRRLSLDDLE
jgi:hypothetical protein